jgi:hypothetical protein
MQIKATLVVSIVYDAESVEEIDLYLKHHSRTQAFRDGLSHFGEFEVKEVKCSTSAAAIRESIPQAKPIVPSRIVIISDPQKPSGEFTMPLVRRKTIAFAPPVLSKSGEYSIGKIDSGWE